MNDRQFLKDVVLDILSMALAAVGLLLGVIGVLLFTDSDFTSKEAAIPLVIGSLLVLVVVAVPATRRRLLNILLT